jgi:predicted ester cyclase
MKTRSCFAGIVASLSLLILPSCQGQQAKEELARFRALEAKKARNIETVRRFYEHLDRFLNEDDQKAFMNLWASNSKRFGGSSDESMSIEEMTPFLKAYYTAFPDLKHHLVNILAEDDYVVVQLKYSGTQVGEFMGIRPSRKKIDCKGIHILKVDADKITELHFLDDDLTMFTQLGRELK